MLNNAASFIRNRKEVVAITYDRVTNIIWYVAECYQILSKEHPTYSKKLVRETTTIHFEDYLKMEFVDKYLRLNKHFISSKCSELENINFHYENQTRYIDISDKKQKPDKIDIYINRLCLQSSWNQPEENVYYAIECKRIKTLPDCKTYIRDTQNFADRSYNDLRLPFEGQIAFIENSRLSHSSVSAEINNRLKATSSLITTQFLKSEVLHKVFSACYSSRHKRNFSKSEPFTVFHLLFNYSGFVTD